MLVGFERLHGVPHLRSIELDGVVETRQVPGKVLVDGFRPESPERVAAEVRVVELRRLDRVVAGDEGIDGPFAILARGVEQIGGERFVWLRRHILGHASPQVIFGDGRDVPQRLPVSLGLVHRRLGYHRPGGSPAAAFGDVGCEPGHAGGAAGQRVDVLVRRDPLGRVDRQRVAEAEQQPTRGVVCHAPPFNIGNPPFGPKAQPIPGSPKHLDHIAVAADLLIAPFDLTPEAPEQSQPVPGCDRHVVGLPALVDGLVHHLVTGDFAPFLQPLPDGLADRRRVVVGRRRNADSPLGAGSPQEIAPFDVEVGDPGRHLVEVAAHQHGMAVVPLHRQRLGRLAVAEQPGDLLSAVGHLPHRGQQLRRGFRRKRPAEDLDRVAGLDGLGLLPIAHHFDRHASPGLQLQQLEHRPRSDLAHLVHHQHRVPVGLEVAGFDHSQKRRQRIVPIDSGILQSVGLSPRHRRADDVPAAGAESCVCLPGLHQRLQDGVLSGAGDAGQQAKRTARADCVYGRLLVVSEPLVRWPGRIDRGDGVA